MALSALWYLGKEDVNAEVVGRIREGLSEEEFEKLRSSRMPAWMASAIDQYGRKPTGSGAKNRVQLEPKPPEIMSEIRWRGQLSY